MNQAVEQGGRVVNDLLPYIIGEDERTMVISKKDGKTQSVTVNAKDKEGNTINDLGIGDFDVEIDSGPSFAVQKEIALEMFSETIQAFPQAFPLVADLWAGNLDIQQMDQVKERFKSLVPPDILAKEEGKQPPPKQPDPQAMMMQMEMQAKQAEIKNKMAEVQLKAQKLELEKQQAQLDEVELLLKAQKDENEMKLNVYDHQLNLEKARVTHGMEHHKTNMDFEHKASQILADLYKHVNPQKKEKSE